MSQELIATNFKQLRETMGFTQQKMAEYLGCSREEISYYENENREIPLLLLEKAADLFGVELSDFFNTENAVGIRIAYRANDYAAEDLHEIARFKRIVKNYQRVNRLMARVK
ncbi:helix-turn-helix domain-containing protein [Fluviicola taffensis]|uniref:Helix-turn-helix domain protein n=1 Tax=Fluviicola taffensis (strain DSM 16823 / NCIMB 13979 / RW262) TaxID=755732 RepID=F2IGY9_FLUTR|nr:helix-turn-helix transcriptional regulator [Fluviicola taffensis]AEA44770.1 helix-turn-helix domain protein [Fluviicola taffensis DSM 16823]